MAITIGLTESAHANEPENNLTDDFEAPVTRALPRPMFVPGWLQDGKRHGSMYPCRSVTGRTRWPESLAAMHLHQMLQDKKTDVTRLEHIFCSTGDGLAMAVYFKWRSEFVIGLDEFSRLLKNIKRIANQHACAKAFVAIAGMLENNTEDFKAKAHAALTQALSSLFRATERNEAFLVLAEKIRSMQTGENRRKAFGELVQKIQKNSKIQLIGLAKAAGYLPEPERQKAFDGVWPMTGQVSLDIRISTFVGFIETALDAPGVSLKPMFAHLDPTERDAVINAAVKGLSELKMGRFLEALADGDFCRAFAGLLQVMLNALRTSSTSHQTKLNTLRHFIHGPMSKYSLNEISHFIRNSNENYFFPLIEDLLRQRPCLSSEEREAIVLEAENRLAAARHGDTLVLRRALKLKETDGMDKIIEKLAAQLETARSNSSCNVF